MNQNQNQNQESKSESESESEYVHQRRPDNTMDKDKYIGQTKIYNTYK